MMNYIYVMIGGAIGAVLRYGIARLCVQCAVMNVPVGTFVVNAAGCFLLGLISALAEVCPGLPRGLVLMLTAGMCGAFTTFSTFSAETISLLDGGRILAAMGYVVASIGIGLLFFVAGRSLANGVSF